jgi:putative transposase
MLRKRHTLAEISTKLLQSDEMAELGKPQAEIAQALGISLMTYHRWRKARRESPSEGLSDTNTNKDSNTNGSADTGDLVGRISHLHSENSRLRRLVTDLILETDKLEELLALSSPRNRTGVPGASIQKQSNIVRRIQKRRQELGFTTGKTR